MTTRIERAKEKAEDLQTAVMMLADTVGSIVTIVTFAIVMLTYEYGILYLLLAIVIGIVGKMFSLKHTEKETELNINQTLSRRKCDYLFELQTERTSMMELKIDKAYAFLRNKCKRGVQMRLFHVSEESNINIFKPRGPTRLDIVQRPCHPWRR